MVSEQNTEDARRPIPEAPGYQRRHVLEVPEQDATGTHCTICGEKFSFSDPDWQTMARDGLCYRKD